jgi:hypothetical protein
MTPTTPILWIHADNLSPHSPAWQAHPHAPAVFVFDDALLSQWHISLKRITFIYECLLELPVEIRRGDVAAQVSAFAQAHGASTIVTLNSPSPRFADIRAQLAGMGLTVQVLNDAPFVELEGRLDLKRFSRYWDQARRALRLP